MMTKSQKTWKPFDLPFFLLASKVDHTPLLNEELLFMQAGLGKRTLSVASDLTHAELSRMLQISFPKMACLQDRWLLFKATGGNGRRKIAAIPLEAEGYTGTALKSASSGGKFTLYIVPLQDELDLTPLPADSPEFALMPKAACRICKTEMPLQMLAFHVKECGQCSSDLEEEDVMLVGETDPTSASCGTSANIGHLQENKVCCPICCKMFADADIEAHASDCGRSLEEMPSGIAECIHEENRAIENVSDVIQAIMLAVQMEKAFELTVSRHNVVERGLVQWQRQKKSSPVNYLKVTFLGEAGVDTGALRKEFLTKMVEGIEKRFFEKGTHGSSPAYSVSDFDKGFFRTVGEIFAASLAQGGPAPNFMMNWCYQYLCEGSINSEDLKKTDVADSQYTDLMSRIEAASQPEANLSLTEDIVNCGYTGIINADKKAEMMRAVVLHATLRLLPILQQVKEGLQLFGLSAIMARHPEVCKALFVPGDEAAADADFISTIIRAEYSEEGSNKRQIETIIMDHFQDFIQELEQDGNEMSPLCPKDIMQWITGQAHIPHLQEEKKNFHILMKFNHDCGSVFGQHRVCYPVVAACANTITIPVIHMKTYQEFRDILVEAYHQGQEFSCV